MPNIDPNIYEKVSTEKTVISGIKIHFKSLKDSYKKKTVAIPSKKNNVEDSLNVAM